MFEANWRDGSDVKVSFACCLLAGQISFLMTLFFYHEVRTYLTGWWGPTVFLDKTCIHQTDMQLQIAGISKLGAFIRNSNCVVVLYGEQYLERLWTIYEA